jgi:hypothetical protein
MAAKFKNIQQARNAAVQARSAYRLALSNGDREEAARQRKIVTDAKRYAQFGH